MKKYIYLLLIGIIAMSCDPAEVEEVAPSLSSQVEGEFEVNSINSAALGGTIQLPISFGGSSLAMSLSIIQQSDDEVNVDVKTIESVNGSVTEDVDTFEAIKLVNTDTGIAFVKDGNEMGVFTDNVIEFSITDASGVATFRATKVVQ